MAVTIDLEKCTGCGTCTYLCPAGVLYVEDGKCRQQDGCVSCGNCIAICPVQAIS